MALGTTLGPLWSGTLALTAFGRSACINSLLTVILVRSCVHDTIEVRWLSLRRSKIGTAYRCLDNILFLMFEPKIGLWRL